jgi:prevent-host-death family protein
MTERPSNRWTVREARAHFSEIVDAAARGEEIIITSHGEPKVKIVGYEKSGRPMKVDRKWLYGMPVPPRQTPSEVIIREDRDARG